MLATLNEVLKKAKNEKYAVGLFNTVTMEMLDAAISAAEELRSPIIIGTAEVLLPYGELDLIAPSVIEKARNASVPVVVHYDHGLTFERVMQAIKLGFTSVMYDCSTLSEKENIEATREVVKTAHAFGVSVEAEIGHIGGAEDAIDGGDTSDGQYTTVEEATRFSIATGVDALAVAVGTAHGNYKVKPKLDFDRISAICKSVSVPLVLHGGSGLSTDDLKEAIEKGISKVNIFTDLCNASVAAMRKGLDDKLDYLKIRNLQKSMIEEEVKRKIKIFGSEGKGL